MCGFATPNSDSLGSRGLSARHIVSLIKMDKEVEVGAGIEGGLGTSSDCYNPSI